MKKLWTKIVSLVVTLAMTFALSQAVLAAPLVKTASEGEVLLQYSGHGQYVEVPVALNSNIVSRAEGQNVGSTIVATLTDDADLLFLSEDDYFLRVSTDNKNQSTYLFVQRNDIDVKNFTSDSLDQFCFPAELVERVEAVIESQKAAGNDKFEMAVFMPSSMLKDHNGTCVYSNNTAVPTSYEESWEEYYTLNGKNFIDKYIKSWNYSCSYSKSGDEASKAASEFSNLVLTCAGALSMTVTAFTIGYSALKTLAAALGISETQAGNGYSKIQTIVTYDAVYRLTYWNYGGNPYVGTCKAWLNTNATQQTSDKYPSGVYQTETPLNKEMLSPHYSNPAEWLDTQYYDAAYIIEGPIYLYILDQRYMLV